MTSSSCSSSIRGTFSTTLAAILCLLSLSACAGLPRLQPPVDPPAGARLPFPQGRWQLVHGIEARFPGNHKALMMGALELDSASGRLSCALMTVEGFTLFSADFDPGALTPLTVTRAVPPFDGPGFAEGLMADLRLVFFAPRNARRQMGSADQKPVWRFDHYDGSTTDVKVLSSDQYQIDYYTADAKQIRRAVLRMTSSSSSAPRQDMAQGILLEALDDAHYTLRLDLIDAVPLGADDANGTDTKDAS
jgi:hypothetical protein